MNKESDFKKEVAYHIELHSVTGIRSCFEKGLDANALYDENTTLFELLTGMYTRTPKFKECVRLFVDYGLVFENEVLLAVLLDDSHLLTRLIQDNPEIVAKKITMTSAYTSLENSSLLHVCAEFNHVVCARVLMEAGMDVDVKSGLDENNFGGQTPLFHTVNQNMNNSKEMMDLLLDNGADLRCTVRGMIWGKNYPWETFIPAVNPVSYAMMGLLPQMHRDEATIAGVVQKLVGHAFGVEYNIPNIPNEYLKTP